MKLNRVIRAASFFVLIVLSVESPPLYASNETRVRWTGRPFDVTIPVGVERVFKFDAQRIQVAFPTDLWGIASAESSQGIVYVRSSRPFDNVRVRFRNKDTGKIYSINVSAVSGESDLSPVVIVDDVDSEIDNKTPAVSVTEHMPENREGVIEGVYPSGVAESAADHPLDEEPEPVRHGVTTLVRFAMQQVYAPERLIEALDDVYRVSFSESEQQISLLPGSEVKSRVLGQWKNSGRYITAIYLQNMSEKPVELDPRILTGRQYWQIAALMHSVLTPANRFGDSTTLVAISDKKWVEYSKWLR